MPDNLEDLIIKTQAGPVLFLREDVLKGASEDEDERLALLKSHCAETLPPELFSRKLVWDYVNGCVQPENMRLIRENEAAMQAIALAVYDPSLILVVDTFPGNVQLKALAGYVLAWELRSGFRTPDIVSRVDLQMAARASHDPWLKRMAAYAQTPLSD